MAEDMNTDNTSNTSTINRDARRVIAPGKRGRLHQIEKHLVGALEQFQQLKELNTRLQNDIARERAERTNETEHWEVEIGIATYEVQKYKDEAGKLNSECQSVIAEKDALQEKLEIFRGDVDAIAGLSSAGLESFQNCCLSTLKLLQTEIAQRLQQSSNGASSSWMMQTCSICCDTEKVPNALLSCGHTFCNDCASRIDSCATCKAPVSSVSKLFGLVRK